MTSLASVILLDYSVTKKVMGYSATLKVSELLNTAILVKSSNALKDADLAVT